MKIAAVLHDEYFGTVQLIENDVADDATSQQIWENITGIKDRSPQHSRPGYIEDWDAYGSKHNGMLTRIWWGANAGEAKEKYQEIRQSGVPDAIS